MAKISTVIAVKNRVEYLGSALLSLLNQTFEDWEAIIVDDGSTDDIAAIVSHFNDPRFKLVRNEREPGISGARNYGNSLATAPIIAVFDSDDISLPRRFEVTMKAFEANPDLGVFYGNIYHWNENGYDEKSRGMMDIRAYRHFEKFDPKLMYTRDIVCNGASAYRKEVIEGVQYDPTLSSAEDYDFFMQLIVRGVKFDCTEEPLLLYRRHNDQTGSTPERRAQWQKNIEEVHRRYKLP